MAKQFPKKLFVKIEKDGSTEYFCADESAAALVEMNDTMKIATYQLIETAMATGEARFSKPKRQ